MYKKFGKHQMIEMKFKLCQDLMIRQTWNLNEVVINPCSCVSVQFWMKKNIKEHVCCFVGIAILPLTHAKKKILGGQKSLNQLLSSQVIWKMRTV